MFSFGQERVTAEPNALSLRSVEGIEPQDPSPEHAHIFHVLEQGLHFMELGMGRLHDHIRPVVNLTEGIHQADMEFIEELIHALFPPSKSLPCPDDVTIEHFGEDAILSFFKLALSNQTNWERLQTVAFQVHHPIFATKLLHLLCEAKFQQNQLCAEDAALLNTRIQRWMTELRREQDALPPELHIVKIREWYWRRESRPLEAQAPALEELFELIQDMERTQKFARDRDHVRVQAMHCLLELGWDEEAKDQLGYMEDAIGIFEGNLMIAKALADRKDAPVTGLLSGSYRQEPEAQRWQRYYRSAHELYQFHERNLAHTITRTDIAEWRAALIQAQLHLGLHAEAEQTAQTVLSLYGRAEHVYVPFVDQALASERDDVTHCLRTFAQEVEMIPSGELIATDLGLLEVRAGLTLVRRQYKAWKELTVPVETAVAYLRRALRAEDDITAQVLLLLLPVRVRTQLFARPGWDQQEFALGNVLLGQVERLYPGARKRAAAPQNEQTPPMKAEFI